MKCQFSRSGSELRWCRPSSSAASRWQWSDTGDTFSPDRTTNTGSPRRTRAAEEHKASHSTADRQRSNKRIANLSPFCNLMFTLFFTTFHPARVLCVKGRCSVTDDALPPFKKDHLGIILSNNKSSKQWIANSLNSGFLSHFYLKHNQLKICWSLFFLPPRGLIYHLTAVMLKCILSVSVHRDVNVGCGYSCNTQYISVHTQLWCNRLLTFN